MVYDPGPVCPSCNGTGQPGGVKGGPELGLCHECMGTGHSRGMRDVLVEAYMETVKKTSNPVEDWKPDHVTHRSYLSGKVKRYSVWPTLKEQSVADHTWGVYHTYWRIFGAPAAEVALYIHLHDAEELVGGDNPFPSKMMFPKLKEATKEVEVFARKRLDLPEHFISEVEQHRVKVCDLLEMMQFGMLERETGNLLATPIVERTGDTALKIAAENLSNEDYGRVARLHEAESVRHREVINKQGSTY